MKAWEIFESECVNYLNQQFGMYARFTLKGRSDSTNSDILVNTRSGKIFFIEAKLTPAQCGQFVLLPNVSTSSFEYSPKNENNLNEYAQTIISHMNTSFNEFYEPGTAGKEIDIPNQEYIFSQWVINNYLLKGVRFVITNNFMLFPIDQLPNIFSLSATYRTKRSGSRDVGTKDITKVFDYLMRNYIISDQRIEKGKLYICSPDNLHNIHFNLDEHEYMISYRNGEYEIRKLSNTFNSNVIFSIKQKATQHGISHEEFISYLLS